MRKKGIISFLVLAMIATLLFGCGSNSGMEATNTDNASKEKTTDTVADADSKDKKEEVQVVTVWSDNAHE